MDIKKQKTKLRNAILEKRNRLTAAYRTETSHTISTSLLGLDSFQQSTVIAAYISFGSEFQTDTVLDAALRLGKTIVLPKIEPVGRTLSFRTFSGKFDELLRGRWGIPEPDPEKSESMDYSQIEFIIVPGVAFSEQGFRLGYGGGYYDSFISQLPKSSVTVAPTFPIQVLPEVPLEAHDLKVDMLITN
jgi:5-formyltetrahydrofolate cyclo-ligase